MGRIQDADCDPYLPHPCSRPAVTQGAFPVELATGRGCKCALRPFIIQMEVGRDAFALKKKKGHIALCSSVVGSVGGII